MATILNCHSRRKICKDNLLLTEYSLELSRKEIESPGICLHEYIISEEEFELVWAVKTSNINSCWPSLVLKSSDSNEIFVNVIVFTRQSGDSKWFPQEDTDRSLFPDKLQWCRRDVAVLNIDNDRHDQMKIAFKIYFLNKDAFTDDTLGLIKLEQTSDVTFVVGEEKFTGHQYILSKRSPVFAKMFHRDAMQEEKKNCVVEVKDMEPETFNLMMEFIYNGHIVTKNHPAINYLELMLAADNFEVAGNLKSTCAKRLSEDLSPENAVDMYVLFDRVNENKLKNFTADYIFANKNEVARTVQYEKMISLCPNLVTELFRRVMSEEYCIEKLVE